MEYLPPAKKPRNEGKYNVARIPDVIEAAARFDMSLKATSVTCTTALFNHGCPKPVTVGKVRSSSRTSAREAIASLKGHKIRGTNFLFHIRLMLQISRHSDLWSWPGRKYNAVWCLIYLCPPRFYKNGVFNRSAGWTYFNSYSR